MHVLEVWMCYVLMLTVSEKKIVRILHRCLRWDISGDILHTVT